MKKRLIVSTITGAILGIFCIVGAQVRYDVPLHNLYLFSFWFNRVLIGLVIGLLVTEKNTFKMAVRGLLVGLFVSFAFYSSTDFYDPIGFIAGGVYGIIIEFVAKKVA
ncbi:MAG: hypothetical protein JXR62_03580 [Bacilli bacterium]|nr:hypothetical protein [Bacilli bacterium]